MKAVVQRCYGPPSVLRLEEAAKPVPEADQVLVKVHAAAVNPLDWHYMRGEPYIMRLSSGIGAPTDTAMGVDFAGVVEAVGADVRKFKVGDAVFGGRGGALAEYVVVRESRAVAHKPENLSFEQAAAMPIAAVTAIQGLRDHGKLKAGQKVLINGASGGVGTFAVQIAKSMGAEVTGVCSTRNVELVRSLGADHVIDYTQQNFTKGDQRYDLILDNVGSHSFRDYGRVLEPDGVIVVVGGPSENVWIGPLIQTVKGMALSPFMSQEIVGFLAELNQSELEVLASLAREGKLTAAIDRRYPLDRAAEAIEYLEQGRARGKVIVTMHDQR
ncbi:NAD(P)-dependent alcohol dehydrogenase [Steroidobacter sp.]|uniref:NAD(P)-dependent alcohol dehydrogenase n=1 Tax=Steroidobacter sp. TaxID=1978227 RepID=UPI0032C233A5